MTSQTPKVVPGFETAETFPMTMEFGKFILRLTPLLVMAGVFLTFLATIIGYAADLSDAATWAIAVACGVAGSVLMVFLKKLQFEAMLATTVLEISPTGLTASDPHLRTELAWSKADKIGHSSMMDPLRARFEGNLLASVLTTAGSLAARRRESAIIGAGRLIVDREAPKLLREQVRQNDQNKKIRPESGQPERAILLQHFDKNWQDGRIGAWVRAYRPDLMDSRDAARS
ncbi:MAG: hypothetical protein ACRDXX_01660 [Stackebrandtia sp.]